MLHEYRVELNSDMRKFVCERIAARDHIHAARRAIHSCDSTAEIRVFEFAENLWEGLVPIRNYKYSKEYKLIYDKKTGLKEIEK